MRTRARRRASQLNFSHFSDKYPFAAFWQTGPDTLTGSITTGPFAGTKALRLQQAAPLYYWGIDLGNRKTWFYSAWIKPIAIGSTVTFFVIQDDEVIPNLTTTCVLQIDPNGHIIVAPGAGTNVFVFPSDFDRAITSGNFIKSAATCPFGSWTHVCARFDIPSNASSGHAVLTLWINGNLDTQRLNVTLPAPLGGGSNRCVNCWTSDGSNDMHISQLFFQDNTGSLNNTNVSPTRRITTIFPTSDVDNGNWTPLVAGPNYQMVNSAIGPSVSDYVSIASLIGGPDELFGITPLATADSNVAVVVNIASQLSGSATLQALVKQGATRYLIGSPLTVPNPVVVQQGIAEVNPATGSAWKDADISAEAWGFRGLTGTGELVEQFFLEKVWELPIGSYSY